MTRALREPQEVESAIGGFGEMATGAITEDEDFKEFMKVARLLERVG